MCNDGRMVLVLVDVAAVDGRRNDYMLNERIARVNARLNNPRGNRFRTLNCSLYVAWVLLFSSSQNVSLHINRPRCMERLEETADRTQ